jgi:hypothetical protein
MVVVICPTPSPPPDFSAPFSSPFLRLLDACSDKVVVNIISGEVPFVSYPPNQPPSFLGSKTLLGLARYELR